MAFFARPAACYGAPETSFTPFFSLLNDIDTISREVQSNHAGRRHRRSARTFNPRFDVRETETAYELHGELPGVAKENLHIEFTEPQTIVISGRVERSYTNDTPTAATKAVEDAARATDNAAAEADWESVNNEKEATPSHQATVSDEESETAKAQGTPAPEQSSEKPQQQVEEPKAPADKYWVSERSIGEFARSFSFQGRVEQDGVTAHLNNGILSVSVPKAKKHEPQLININ